MRLLPFVSLVLLLGCRLNGFGAYEKELGLILEKSDGSYGFWGTMESRSIQCKEVAGGERLPNLIETPKELSEMCDFYSEYVAEWGDAGASSPTKDVLTVSIGLGGTEGSSEIYSGNAKDADELVGMSSDGLLLSECYGEDISSVEESRLEASATIESVTNGHVSVSFEGEINGTVRFALCD